MKHSARAGIALWGLTSDVLTHPSAAMHRLTESEERRARRFHRAEDRDSFRAAHLLVRICGERAGLPSHVLDVVQRCGACGGDHGPPRLAAFPELRVSLAHARGAVAAAVAPAAVGVDIEPAVRLDPSSIARVFSVEEAAWLAAHPEDAVRLWCRKEAAPRDSRSARSPRRHSRSSASAEQRAGRSQSSV